MLFFGMSMLRAMQELCGEIHLKVLGIYLSQCFQRLKRLPSDCTLLVTWDITETRVSIPETIDSREPMQWERLNTLGDGMDNLSIKACVPQIITATLEVLKTQAGRSNARGKD